MDISCIYSFRSVALAARWKTDQARARLECGGLRLLWLPRQEVRGSDQADAAWRLCAAEPRNARFQIQGNKVIWKFHTIPTLFTTVWHIFYMYYIFSRQTDRYVLYIIYRQIGNRWIDVVKLPSLGYVSHNRIPDTCFNNQFITKQFDVGQAQCNPALRWSWQKNIQSC